MSRYPNGISEAITLPGEIMTILMALAVECAKHGRTLSGVQIGRSGDKFTKLVIHTPAGACKMEVER